jgi:hypothetical protein
VVLGDSGDHVELRGRHWTGRHELEDEGRSGAGARTVCRRAAAGASRPSVRGLYRRARQREHGFGSAAVWAGCLGVRTWTLAGAPGRRMPTDRWVQHGAVWQRVQGSSCLDARAAWGRRGLGKRSVARTPRDGHRHAAAVRRALERGRAVFQPVNATLTAFFSKKLNRSAQSGE